MDPALALVPLGPPPHVADNQVLVLPGAFLPVLLPLTCYAPAQRMQALAAIADAPLATRVQAAIEAGALTEAWREAAAWRGPLASADGLEDLLSRWGAQRLELQHITPTQTPVLGLGDAAVLEPEVAEALDKVHQLLDPWPWPRWFGQVLLVPGTEACGDLPAGAERLVRPILPMLRVPQQPTQAAWAAALLRLTMDLSAPPQGGWPSWLDVGLEQMAAARADYRALSPSALADRRAAAGANGLAALLVSTQADPGLATAVVYLLLHPRHRAAFGSALDLLRNGADSRTALRIAYGMGLEELAHGE
jgi:hypothetical protein